MAGSLLEKLIGDRLGSVVFVADYLQLVFTDARLTVYVWPTVAVGPQAWSVGGAGYRDALCALIGHEVQAACEAPETGLTIRIGPAMVRIDPRQGDLRGPEIAYLTVHDPMWQTDTWDVWRPGEGIFSQHDWS